MRPARIHSGSEFARALSVHSAIPLLSIILTVLALLVLASPAAAQDAEPTEEPPIEVTLPPVEPLPVEPTVRPPVVPPDEPRPDIRTSASAARLTQHTVEATVEGSVASVHVTQVFFNPTQRQIESSYVFPLPADAAVGDLQMTIDGEVVEGEIYRAEEARAIYEEIVRSARDPALLEHVGEGLFRLSVFPIPPGETRRVELSYRQVLDVEEGLHRLRVPMSQMPNQPTAETYAVSVQLVDQPGLRTVYSPSHNVSVQRQSDDAADVGFESQDSRAQQDFVLYFGTDASRIGVDLLSYKSASEDGFFLLLAAPGVDATEQEIVARDLVLVLDVSGSMEGEKIRQARDAARYVVQNLNPDDRFSLISFSTATDVWWPELQTVTAENQQAALDWIDGLQAQGSTDINRALLDALALLGQGTDTSGARPAYVLFLTDGLPTQGESDPNRILANVEQNVPRDRTIRLFSFGVGFDVNTDLLDTISRNLGGRSHYVLPDEAIDEAVSTFYASISTPVLTNVTIDVEGAQVNETYPFPLPDLFAGEQLLWVGRYREGGPVRVTLRGEVNGVEQSFVYDDLSLADLGGEAAVARIWATRKIGSLLSEVRRNGPDQELIDAIVDLSLEYGIVTPYTSYLVLEPGARAGFAMDDADDGEMTAEPALDVAEAPASVREDAAGAVSESVEALAAEEESGEAAVRGSIARQELESAETVEEQQGVRYVAGKSFTDQGVRLVEGEAVPFWVDTSYEESMPIRTVPFGSEAYFDLLARPQMSQWLSLSSEMVVVVDGEAIQVTAHPDAGSEVEATPAPQQQSGETGSVQPDSQRAGIWQAILSLLSRLFGR